MYLKMHLPKCLCMSVLLMIADGFVVQSPSGPLVVPLGGSVVLPCSVDTLLPVEGLEVEWKRDSGTLVHLFQDGESRPESQHQDYYDRAHFFTEEIQHGNFSLLLNNVRAEDKGEYRCKVYSDQDSDENVVEIKYVERLIVSGSNHSISPYEGEDVTLSCSVDSHIPPEEIEEVSWKKIDKDGEILVLLFQYNEIRTESTPDQYKDRAEFFADEIPKANFSLRLKSVRNADKGVYMCLVFAGDFSANTTMEVKISLSTLHIVVLLLCGLAFGSASLLGCLVLRKINSEHFHGFSVLCWSFHLLPNLFMVTAFIIWGFIDGSLNEVISCSTLNLLRPLLLIVTVPQEVTDSWNQAPSTGIKHTIFSMVFYSVLLHNAWERQTFYHQNDLAIVFIMFILAVTLLITICYGASNFNEHLNGRWGHALIIQFCNIPTICFLHYSFGQTREETLILPLAVVVVVIFLMIARTRRCYFIKHHKFHWSMVILIFVLLESGVMVYHHYSVLEHEKDHISVTLCQKLQLKKEPCTSEYFIQSIIVKPLGRVIIKGVIWCC
uniref:Ig-like domain-containing protein n=1 Tax=Cyprinus carpio TaxID=7962 RepID=A0A8C2IFL6_CYPCA